MNIFLTSVVERGFLRFCCGIFGMPSDYSLDKFTLQCSLGLQTTKTPTDL